MFELEVEVMVVGLWAEAYLFDSDLCGFSFLLFLSLFLLIEIFLVIHYFAHRGLRCGRDLYEVQLQLFGNAASFLNRIYTLLDIVAYESHFAGTDILVDGVEVLFLIARHWRPGTVTVGMVTALTSSVGTWRIGPALLGR